MTCNKSTLWKRCLWLLPPFGVLGLAGLLSRSQGDDSLLLFLLCLWGAYPLAVIFSAFQGGKEGLHPFLFALSGLILVMLPLLGAVATGALSMVLGIVACVTGREWQKHRGPGRRKHHGKQ